MPISIESQTFQETREALERLAGENEEFLRDKELQDKLVREKGLDPKEFDEAYKSYVTEYQGGRRDFRPKNTMYGRFAGRVVGEVVEGVEGLAGLAGVSIKEGAKDLSNAVFGHELSDKIEEDLESYLDPYHGDDTLADIENIGGQIASFFVPYTGAMKLINLGGKAANATRLSSVAGKAVPKRLKTQKAANIGKMVVAGAAADAFLTGKERTAIEEVLNDDDAVDALRRLEENESDPDAKKYLDDFLFSLGIGAGFVGVGLPLMKGYQALKGTGTGQAVTRLGKKYIGRNFSSRGGTDDVTLGLVVESNKASRAALERADGVANDLNRAVSKANKKGANISDDSLNLALSGDQAAMSALPSEVAEQVTKMRSNMDDISKYLSDNIYTGELKATFDKNMGTYINRNYAIFDDPTQRKLIQKSVGNYIAGKGVKDANVKQTIDNTVEYLRKKYPNASPQEINNKLKQLVDTGNQQDANAFFDIVGAVNPLSSSKELRRRTEIPKEIKALWGEVKNPYQNYVNTYTKLATQKAQHDFVGELGQHLVKTGKAVGIDDLPVGQDFVKFGDIAQKYSAAARQQAEAVFDPNVAEQVLKNPNIKDLYVSPEYSNFLKDSLDFKETHNLLQTWAAGKGITQAAKTIYNPATHGRNTVGNVVLTVANGMNPFNIATKKGRSAVSDAMSYVGNRVVGKRTNTEQAEKFAEYLSQGIVDSEISLNIVKSNINRMKDQKSWLNGLADNKVSRAYEAEDAVFKIMHYEKTKDMLKKAYPDMDDKELVRMAGQRTRDLMPNYNLVPRAFKSLKAAPIGDFVAFPAEMARVSKNLVKYTLQDAFSGNATLAGQAAKRLAGMTAVAVAPSSFENMSAEQHGITDEERESLDLLDKNYYQGSNKIYMSGIQEGSGGNKFVDRIVLGPLDPFDSIRVAAKGLHSAFLSDSIPENLSNRVALGALERTVSPFIGPSMLTEALLKLDQDPDAVNAYNDSTALGAGVKSVARAFGVDQTVGAVGVGTLASAFEPGFLTFIKQRADYEQAKAKQLGYDSWMDAIGEEPTGDELTNYYTPLSRNLIPDLTGFRVDRYDITGSVGRNVRPIIQDIKEGGARFKNEVTKRNFLPEDMAKLNELYAQDVQKNFKNQLTLKQIMELYGTLGIGFDEYQKGIAKWRPETGEQVFPGRVNEQDLNILGNAMANQSTVFDFSEQDRSLMYYNNPFIDPTKYDRFNGQYTGRPLE